MAWAGGGVAGLLLVEWLRLSVLKAKGWFKQRRAHLTAFVVTACHLLRQGAWLSRENLSIQSPPHTHIHTYPARQAQRDLFAHTSGGDLRPLLSAYFDTSSGVKVEAASYHNIALSLGVDDAQSLLFLTDNPAEARAALEAGWKATLVQRPGNKELSAEEAKSTTLITSFDEI